MDFSKYPSIENYYRERYITEILKHYPEMKDKRYLITEKLHGSNFQLIFNPEKEMLVASRRKLITKGVHGHFGIWEVLEKNQKFVDAVQDAVNHYKKGLAIYGEIFGPGINKGVDYGIEKQIRVFDIRDDNGYWTQEKTIEFLSMIKHLDMFVPIIGTVKNLDQALEFDAKFNSKIINKENNTCEGVVFKPYDHVCVDWNDDLFYLKKKNPEFLENKSKKKKSVISAEVKELNRIFRTYITDVRLQSVFSKEGYITDKTEIGKFVRLLIEDAKEDFLKDYPEITDTKKVFHAGGLPAQLVMSYL